MRNLTLDNNLSQAIFNRTKKFCRFVTRPHQFNLREIVRGMIVSGKIWLNHIAEANGSSNLARKDIERLSNALEKMPYENCALAHVDAESAKYQNEVVLILSDGGDFQKPYAKKMEKVGPAVDGSNGHCVGKGYPAHSLVAYGVKSMQLSPLTLRIFSTLSEDYKSEWDEQKKNFQLLEKFILESAKDRIIVEDRGCDDEKRFLYFTKELGANFVTRILAGKNSRKVLVPDSYGRLEELSIQEITAKIKDTAGSSKTWWNEKIKKNLVSKIAFQKVYLKGHEDIPLYAIFCFSEGYDEPLVVLTSLKTANFTTAWEHFFYYKKRWEVENFYRAIKQQFEGEKFLIQKFEKIRMLLFLLMISYSILLEIQRKFLELCGTMYLVFREFCRRSQRSGQHHLDVLAFIRRELAPTEYDTSYKFYSHRLRKVLYLITKNQLQIFNLRKKW